MSRAEFLGRAGGALAVVAFGDLPFGRMTRLDGAAEHPEPRAGVTAERVLPVEKLGDKPSDKVLDSYEGARKYPAIFDGILCSCSCGGKKGTHRSLLICFETPQATGCGECQLEGVFVGKLAKEGKSLAEIRTAFDKEFG